MPKGSLRTVLVFTLAYGVLAIGLMAGQPRSAAMQVADAGGNFEVTPGSIYFRLASAE